METIERMRDNKWGRFRRAELRFVDLTIPFGADMTFQNGDFIVNTLTDGETKMYVDHNEIKPCIRLIYIYTCTGNTVSVM